jgi:hypothetical protein
MPRIRILKAEIALCFDRFLIDAEDDFFPDPLRYKDLRLVRDQIVNETQRTLRVTMNQNKITCTAKHHYLWYVPKENFVIREGCSFHPYDIIVFHFILNRLLPIIEPKLSKSRYSYRIKNTKSKKLFGYNPTENWITFKNDMRTYFADNPDYQFMVSTDIAGFFEYIPITIFKKRLLQMSNQNESQSIELLSFMLKEYSSSKYSGMPQNCDPFSYLCTAFLDFLDKELEAESLIHFRYVDDIKVACKTENDAKKAIIQIIQTLRTANLNLSTAKTDIIPVGSDKFKNILKEFPPLLRDIDNAVHHKQKRTINYLYPKLVSYTKQVMKQKQQDFDERLFRACIWRIVKINYFKNIDRIDLVSIGKKCLKLLYSMPSRTNTLLRFLVLHKNRTYVQDALYELLKDAVYPWQEMLIWYLLIQSDKIKNPDILTLAKRRVRDAGYHEAAKNYIYIFLGKHGDYQDRTYMANLFPLTQSFRAQRSILISIQEYQDRNTIYNSITRSNSDPILLSLVQYIKQLSTPEYVDIDKNIASDIAFS